MAELRPVPVESRRLNFGDDKGTIMIRDDFDAPVPEMENFLA
jgi:hypothetical protein